LYESLFIRTLIAPQSRATAQPGLAFDQLVFRRLVAILLMFTLGSFILEESVADVHDGDATAAEIALAGGFDAAPASETPVPSNGTTHDVHVCHCIHAHGVIPPGAAVSNEQPVVDAAVLAFDVRVPPSVDLDVHLRPPIRG
jgi:hypothetical protein